MNDLHDLRGMSAEEAAKHVTCGICCKHVAESGVPLFYLIRIERWGFDVGALKRREGLAQVLGGSDGAWTIMGVMTPDQDVARCVMETRTISVCERCAMSRQSCMVAVLAENATPDKPEPVEVDEEDPPPDDAPEPAGPPT